MSKKSTEQNAQEFLQKYLNNASPTGFEWSGQQIWLEYLKPYIDDYYVDAYGSVVGIINPKADYKVIIEAHSDEISWFVNFITESGYIYVRRNGGSDPVIAPSMRVNIQGKKGTVKGIFGWPAIHVRHEKERDPMPDLKNIYIDIGCSSKQEVLEKGVDIGSVVTFVDEMFELNDKYYVGRALDNRIGGYMIAQVARKLKESKIKLPFGLYIANCVQEEIGLRGAEMVANAIKPNLAIITDVCHDTQAPLYNKIIDGDFTAGKGPVLTFGPAVQNNVLKMLFEVAENKNIAYQRAAVSRSTGTDTDSFAYSNSGVPSALVSLALKYMHTTVEMVHKEDVENIINLMYEFLVQLKNGQDFRYFK
ncbi:MAG: M42 family metallopeptidase [Thermonemataceae bacterium]|nr:M42 family metallopeptidase [Thermonemataceae bacterium]